MRQPLRTALLLVMSLPFASFAWTQATANLSQQGWYAYPEIRIFDHQYWIYPTSSSPTADKQDPSSFIPKR